MGTFASFRQKRTQSFMKRFFSSITWFLLASDREERRGAALFLLYVPPVQCLISLPLPSLPAIPFSQSVRYGSLKLLVTAEGCNE